MSIRTAMFAALAGTALSLSACSEGPDGDTATAANAEPSSATLASLIGDADEYSVVSETLSDAGLAEVFDGNAAYTVLLPSDASFEGMDSEALPQEGDARQAAMVAILRDHIFPGYFSPEDIRNSIGEEDGASVSMKSMGDHELTFSRDGDAILVTNASDGSTARIEGEAMMGSNGVAIPLDGVLKSVGEETPA